MPIGNQIAALAHSARGDIQKMVSDVTSPTIARGARNSAHSVIDDFSVRNVPVESVGPTETSRPTLRVIPSSIPTTSTTYYHENTVPIPRSHTEIVFHNGVE